MFKNLKNVYICCKNIYIVTVFKKGSMKSQNYKRNILMNQTASF